MFVRVWLRDPPACRRKKETGGRRQSAAALGDIAEYGAFERWPSAAPPDRPTRQAVAKHLAVLSRAGLVEGQRQGREVHYTVRPERLDEAAQAMATAAARWDRRLSAIKRLAEEQARDGPLPRALTGQRGALTAEGSTGADQGQGARPAS